MASYLQYRSFTSAAQALAPSDAWNQLSSEILDFIYRDGLSLYRFRPERVDGWDVYIGFIIAAHNEAEVRRIAMNKVMGGIISDDNLPDYLRNLLEEEPSTKSVWENTPVELLSIVSNQTIPGIVLESFRAG
jgi:hypothetical protein